MELTQVKTIKVVAALLLLSAITQPIFTALFLGAPDVAARQALWALEGLVFVFLAAFAGSAFCLLYTSPSPRDLSTSRMPSSA